MNEETDSILYWKQRLEDMTRRWDARVHEVHLLRQDMDKRIAEAVAAEREECARLCEKAHIVKNGEIFAATIRARGQA